MRPNDLLNTMLEELEDDQRIELGDLTQVAKNLAAWQTPEPTAVEHQHMTQRLLANVNERRRPTEPNWRSWIDLVFAQARLFEPEFIYTCAGILAVLVCGSYLVGFQKLPVFIVFVSPLLAVAGVMYTFHHESDALSSIEAVSPIGPLGLLFIRSALVLGMNLITFLVMILTIGAIFPDLSLWRLMIVWLGVLTGLFGLAIYTSTRWNGFIGVVLPFGIWGALLVSVSQHAVGQVGQWNRVLDWCLTWLNTSNWLLAASLLGLGVGVGLFIQSARYTQTGNPRWL